MNRRELVQSALALLPVLASCGRKSFTPAEGFVKVPGGRVWYQIAGGGKATPLLVLHGGPGMPSHYLQRLDKLADERPVIFYDQLGAGRSDRPSDPALWTVDRFVRELEAVRYALRIEDVHILGHSWGSMLAAEYMSRNPSGVRSLILAGPAISIPRWLQDAAALRSRLPEGTRAVLDAHERAGTTSSPEYQDAVMVFYKRHLCRLDPWPAEMQAAMDQMGVEVYNTMWGPSEFHATGVLKTFDRTDVLATLRLPVLFTAGRFDEATPEAAESYRRMVPGSELVIFEESSHLPMLEESEKYIGTVREFLRRTEQ